MTVAGGGTLLQKIWSYLARSCPTQLGCHTIIRAILSHLVHLRIQGLGVQVPPGAPFHPERTQG